MSKRRGDDAGIPIQESKDDHRDSDEESGKMQPGFERADQDVLKKRGILKIRRRTGGAKPAVDAPVNSSAFSGVNLFSTNETPPAAASNPFGNVSLFTSKQPVITNGGVKNDSRDSVSTKVSISDSQRCLNQMAALNNSFALWVNEHANDGKLMKAAAFDYIDYARKINSHKPVTGEMPVARDFEPSAVVPSLFDSVKSSAGLFSENASAPLNPPQTTDEDDAVPQEETVPVEDNIQDDEILLHKVRAKVMLMKDGAWNSKGVGDLSILQEKDSKRVYVVLRSETGRITCNIPLYKSIKVKSNAKSVSFAAISYTEDKEGNIVKENDGVPVPFQIRVKTPQLAEELCSKISSALAN